MNPLPFWVLAMTALAAAPPPAHAETREYTLTIGSRPVSVGGHMTPKITINGTLQGNIQNAKHVELKQGSTVTGDIKAGSLSVTAGARMRGNVDFGFDGK